MSGITKSLVYFGTKFYILVGKCPPRPPKISNDPGLIPYKSTNLDRPLDNVKIFFITLFFSFEIWGVLGKLPIPYKITNWDRPLDNVKIIFITLFSVSKYKWCWINCEIKPHWCPYWVKLSPIGTSTQQYISKIWSWYHVESNWPTLEQEPSNIYPKFGPDIRKGFVQQSNLGHKCPVSGITKSRCVFRDKIVYPGG